MKNFKVSLMRSYVVSIEAEDIKSARELSEFYLGDCQDLSNNDDRSKWNFSINDIEMTYNNSIEAEEIINKTENVLGKF